MNQNTASIFSVENDELNSDHRVIFGLIDKVETAIREDQGAEVVSEILTELREYASYHFGAEEALFEINAYPEAQAHLEQHLVFRVNLRTLMALKAGGDKTVRLELLRFLRNWFKEHIMVQDKAYIPYLRDAQPLNAG